MGAALLSHTLMAWQMPRFKVPIARTMLDDPAFSPDPRSHPHFPLNSYKAVPSFLPDGPPSPSDSDSLSSPALSSLSQSPLSSPATSPLSTKKPPPPLPVPEILPKPLTRRVLKPVSTNIPKKSRMKAFVRRLTTRHNLDRIDELDETDPFGGSYHHDGPYEAIGTSLAQPALPRMSSNTAPRGGNSRPSRREVCQVLAHDCPSCS